MPREAKHPVPACSGSSAVRRHFLLQLLGALVVVGALSVAARTFPVVERLSDIQSRVEGLGSAGVVLFPLVYAACNLLLLPAGILSIGGGFFFGLWWGFAVVLAGNLLGAALAMLISRHLARDWLAAKIQKSPGLAALDAAIAREGWKIVLLSQLHPLFPTSLLNYLYGVTRMGYWKCLLYIALGQIPGLFLYAYLGTLGQFGLDLIQGKRSPAGWEYAVWTGGLALSLAVTIGLGRIALRLLREAGDAGGPV